MEVLVNKMVLLFPVKRGFSVRNAKPLLSEKEAKQPTLILEISITLLRVNKTKLILLKHPKLPGQLSGENFLHFLTTTFYPLTLIVFFLPIILTNPGF